LPRGVTTALILDKRGNLWAGTPGGLWKIQISSPGKEPRLLRHYGVHDGLASERIHSLLEARDGQLWAGTSAALNQLTVDEKGNEHFRTYGADEGLSGRAVLALGEDSQGALWAGVDHGLSRIARDGFATFTESEGIGRQSIVEVRETGPDLWSASNQISGILPHHFVNERFVTTRPLHPASMNYQTNLAVTVTDIAAPDRIASGQIVNLSQSGACAHLSVRLAPGAIVKVQVGECALFGHVISCDEEQSFLTDIEIVRVLIGESDLAGLVNAIPTAPGVMAVSTK
jgi:ligand-binding sensor domain-containing protein